MKKFISNLVRVFVLILLLFAGQFFSNNAQYRAKAAGSGQVSANAIFAPLLEKNSIAQTGTTRLFLPLLEKSFFAPAPLWRFGVGQARNPLSAYDSAGMVSMRFGWYLNFSVSGNAPTPYGMEYIPVVRVKQLKLAPDNVTKVPCCVGCGYVVPPEYIVTPSIAQITTIATHKHGLTWLIGNEMDRIDSGTTECSHQDEMVPELYAQAYHDIYSAIKTADPTAQVANGSMVEFTDLRSQYLDKVWAEYIRLFGVMMPVDVWNTHLYVLQEKSCVAFPAECWGADIPAGLSQTSGALYTLDDNKNFSLAWDQLVLLRTWMKSHGQQNKPLIISEYGVLWPTWVSCPNFPDTTGCPFTPEQVRDSLMYPSFNAFLYQTDANLGFPADGNHLVQRWNWFSVDYDYVRCDTGVSYEYFGGSLFNSGLNVPCSPTDYSPPLGLTTLGTYWMQYVRNLPSGSTKPYAP